MKEMKYEEALEELETIAEKMEHGEYDVDQLIVKLKRAKVLIKACKERLRNVDADIQKILTDDKE